MTAPTAAACLLWRWTSRTPDAPARARIALHCALDQLGIRGEALDDGVLAASELVANAAEHAVGPYELHLRRTSAELICEVHDHDPRIPQLPCFPTTAPLAPDPMDLGGGLDALCARLTERGRGLHIVDHLTGGAWGFRVELSSTDHVPVKVAWMVIRS